MAKSGFKIRKPKEIMKQAPRRITDVALASGGGVGMSAVVKKLRDSKNKYLSKYAGTIAWGASTAAYLVVDNQFTDAALLGSIGATAVHGTGEMFPAAKPALGLAGVGANDSLQLSPEESAAYQRAMAQINNALDNGGEEMAGADIDTSLLEGAEEGTDEDFEMADADEEYSYA